MRNLTVLICLPQYTYTNPAVWLLWGETEVGEFLWGHQLSTDSHVPCIVQQIFDTRTIFNTHVGIVNVLLLLSNCRHNVANCF